MNGKNKNYISVSSDLSTQVLCTTFTNERFKESVPLYSSSKNKNPCVNRIQDTQTLSKSQPTNFRERVPKKLTAQVFQQHSL